MMKYIYDEIKSAHYLAQGRAMNSNCSTGSFRFLDANRIHLVKACFVLDIKTVGL